jgi:predicted porin
MQKKLLAVAVAGALGAPALALAQNATVNIYGRFYAEYSKVFQGNSNNLTPGGAPLVDVDFLQNPGSMIGFRGEEKLGGGMSAWFQCETTADWRGQSSEGWCSRNSALGLKGGFGNVFAGNWDTPWKRVQTFVGSNETGVFGSAQLLYGQSTTTNSGAASGGTFQRRQRNSINYDTPNFGGFQVMGAFTVLNTETSTVNAATGSKPRVWSLAAKYDNGPINVNAAYEKHKDVTGAARAGDDKGWSIGAAYTFANSLKVGGLYTQQKFERGTAAAPTEGKVSAWHLGIDWMISGPHGVRAAYTHAGNVKGTNFGGIGGAGGNFAPPYRPAWNAAGQTSADLYQIRYVHALSKRTELTAGWVKIKNKRNAAYQIYGTSTNQPGNDPSAIAIGFDHRF